MSRSFKLYEANPVAAGIENSPDGGSVGTRTRSLGDVLKAWLCLGKPESVECQTIEQFHRAVLATLRRWLAAYIADNFALSRTNEP